MSFFKKLFKENKSEENENRHFLLYFKENEFIEKIDLQINEKERSHLEKEYESFDKICIIVKQRDMDVFFEKLAQNGLKLLNN